MGENKEIQFNLSRRRTLFECVKKGMKAAEIGEVLSIHKSTVSRELQKYRYLSFKAESKVSLCATCSLNNRCNYKHKCGSMMCNLKCVGCKSLEVCDMYKHIECKQIKRFPHICLNCEYIDFCKLNHYSYSPEKANEAAIKIRKESRMGLNFTESEYKELDKTIKDGIEKGQSVYHIVKANKLPRCVKTIYNYSNKGLISVRPIDLPRAVTLKQRRSKVPADYEYQENKNIDRSHRMYTDWLVFKVQKRIILYWQMDFLGAPHESEQMILTLVIPDLEFVYLSPFTRPTQDDVVTFFRLLREKLGSDFSKLFEAILTDRDPRFNDFKGIESDENGEVYTRIFYCNPSESNQKPLVENFNAQIRTVFPKGCNLKGITQELCDEISSNLNSRYLNSIDGTRPVDLFVKTFGESMYQKLGLKIVEPNEVKIVKFNKYN